MTRKVHELLKQADALSADEQLTLASRLIEQARRKSQPAHRRWLDAVGLAPYPLVGEDAQAWVTRTRQESSGENKP
jgi:type II secretory pathway pseudopilin PulG